MSRNIEEAGLSTLLDLLGKSVAAGLNCHAIGRVESFDEAAQTAKVSVMYKRYVNDVAFDYPLLIDVPVVVLSGGDAYLELPVAAGDECLVLFNDRDMDNWFKGGQINELATKRMHSFSDALALVGVRSSKRALSGWDLTRATLKNGTTGVGVSSSKVKVFNNLYTLNTLLQELCTEIQTLVNATAAITVTCSTPGNVSTPPVNAAAIIAAGTQVATTATKIGALLE